MIQQATADQFELPSIGQLRIRAEGRLVHSNQSSLRRERVPDLRRSLHHLSSLGHVNVLVFHGISTDVGLRSKRLLGNVFVTDHCYPFVPSLARLALLSSLFRFMISAWDIFLSGWFFWLQTRMSVSSRLMCQVSHSNGIWQAIIQ